jgi:hypothetical protein
MSPKETIMSRVFVFALGGLCLLLSGCVYYPPYGYAPPRYPYAPPPAYAYPAPPPAYPYAAPGQPYAPQPYAPGMPQTLGPSGDTAGATGN